jgi:hypothetical protein
MSKKKATNNSSEENTPSPADDRIAQRAYQLYEARGRSDGFDVDDWLAAEQEVHANSNSQTQRNSA